MTKSSIFYSITFIFFISIASIFFALLLAIIVGVVYISLAERRIPVSYAKQVRGTKIYGGASTYLPVKLNQAGVIPIIFALSILMFPQMIAQFLANSTNIYVIKLVNFLNLFQQNSPWYLIVYFLLVFIFTYFYFGFTGFFMDAQFICLRTPKITRSLIF